MMMMLKSRGKEHERGLKENGKIDDELIDAMEKKGELSGDENKVALWTHFNNYLSIILLQFQMKAFNLNFIWYHRENWEFICERFLMKIQWKSS